MTDVTGGAAYTAVYKGGKAPFDVATPSDNACIDSGLGASYARLSFRARKARSGGLSSAS